VSRSPHQHGTSLLAHLRQAASQGASVLAALDTDRAPELGPLGDSVRIAVREFGRLREAAVGSASALPAEAWWRCSDCSAKLGAVSGSTVSISRADVQVDVARVPGGVIEAVCPRCRQRQAFVAG